MTGWRRIASRLLFVVAAYACLATSQPRWVLEATPPAAPRVTSPSTGLLVTIESSRPPEVFCHSKEWGTLPLHPIGSGSEFLCPPGCELGKVSISVKGGSGGLCSAPTAPPGEFVRVMKVEPVETWTTSAELRVPLSLREGDGFARATVDVRAEGVTVLEKVRVEPAGVTANLTPFGAVVRDGGRADRWFVDVPLEGSTPPPGLAVVLRATSYAACRGPCSPHESPVSLEVEP
jgi:hypothetical protein